MRGISNKCRNKGCHSNIRAEKLNETFYEFLKGFAIKEGMAEPMLKELTALFNDLNKEDGERETLLKGKLTELQKKIDTIEEKFFVTTEMNQETFEKFHKKYLTEKEEITRDLQNCSLKISNLRDYLNEALHIASNLHEMWGFRDIQIKEKLQKLVFPSGVVYKHKNKAFQTSGTNSVFAAISQLSKGYEGNKKGTSPFLARQSLSAERGGFVHY